MRSSSSTNMCECLVDVSISIFRTELGATMKNLLIAVLLAVTLHRAAANSFCDQEFRCHDDQMNDKINDQIAVELQGQLTYLYMAQLFDHHAMNYPRVAKYFRAKAAEELSHAERFIQYQNRRGGKVVMTGATIYEQDNCAIKILTNVKQAFRCAMELEARVTQSLTQLHQDASELIFDTSGCASSTPFDGDELRLTQPVLVTIERGEGDEKQKETKSDFRNCGCEAGQAGCKVVSFSYVELADMIAHDFLDHQLEDTKEIANYYNTLKNMYRDTAGSAALESWLFDKHLEL